MVALDPGSGLRGQACGLERLTEARVSIEGAATSVDPAERRPPCSVEDRPRPSENAMLKTHLLYFSERITRRSRCPALAALSTLAAILASCVSALADDPRSSPVAPTNQAPRGETLTAYPDFSEACIGFVTGYRRQSDENATLIPSLGRFAGDCGHGKKPLVLGVTHENAKNNHSGAANYDQHISSYMGDFDYEADFGKWLDLQIVSTENPPRILLSLDTANHHKNNVTGWPLQYGHMFVGIIDQTAVAPLSAPVLLDLDIRIRDGGVTKTEPGINGRRILVGALGRWPEASPRTNRTHFLEVNLDQTPNFSTSYNQAPYPKCHDVTYDRCFYGDGRFAEGRTVSYQAVLQGPRLARNSAEWVHISVDIGDLFKRLTWASPPSGWNSARLDGIYLAIESTGAANTTVELRNYRVHTRAAN